jgi:site-specific recombinase XerC
MTLRPIPTSWCTSWTPSRELKRIQEAVGHRCDTSTAIYTHVSSDFMNTALRKALTPAFDQPGQPRKER